MNILNSNNVKVCFLFDTYILYGRLLLFSEWKRLTVIGILNEFHVSQRIQIKTIVLLHCICFYISGNINTKLSKLIFKARGKNLEIKTHKK